MNTALALVTVISFSGPVQGDGVVLAPMALNSLAAVPADIAAAPVMNQSGEVIGKVTRVVADHDGKPAAMSYTTRDGKLVIAAAPAVSYDGQKNILVVQDSPQRMASR